MGKGFRFMEKYPTLGAFLIAIVFGGASIYNYLHGNTEDIVFTIVISVLALIVGIIDIIRVRVAKKKEKEF